MAEEWFDIIDTGVKIGLGALISGIFTYLGLKFKSSSEKAKFILENKSKMLEEISTNVHEYITAWTSFGSRIKGATKGKFLDNEEGSDFTETQRKDIKKYNNQLVDSWSKREAAVAKLTLLKAPKVVAAIKELKDLETELRDKVMFDDIVPLHEEMETYAKRSMKLTTKINKELSDFYSTLAD